MKRIELIDVYKKFGDTEVSRGINLTIEAGTATAIIGKFWRRKIGTVKTDDRPHSSNARPNPC